MDSWHSYPKIYNVGHAAVVDIFSDSLVVQEKVDGSQFSFGRFNGELRCKSKGKEQYPAPDKMFMKAIDIVSGLDLLDGWTYSGEYFQKPKHNTLAYDRIPKNHIILFDIRCGLEQYLIPEAVRKEADRLGFEVVPTFEVTDIRSVEDVISLMERISVLGGSKIEGLVFKNYSRFCSDGKAMMAKHVSELFKENNRKDFKLRNPSNGDILLKLGDIYRSEARWKKAIYRYRDDGKLENAPKDIGPLIRSIQEDVKEECTQEIKEALFLWAWKTLERKVIAGFPEFYKTLLLEESFPERHESCISSPETDETK